MASTVPPCGRGSVQPLWDSTKGRYVEVECPQHHHPSALRNRVGLACTTPRAMPANNLLLRFVKAERGPLQKMLSWAGVEELVL